MLLGLGLGGLLDGILLHQILQSHHMGTDHGVDASYRTTTVASLEDNTFWDGLFHAATWLLILVGQYLLWAALRNGTNSRATALTGLLLTGWGMFNLVEGVVDHLVLGIHDVRDDLGGPLAWDLGFLAFGAVLVVVGLGSSAATATRRRSGAGSVPKPRGRPQARRWQGDELEGPTGRTTTEPGSSPARKDVAYRSLSQPQAQ